MRFPAGEALDDGSWPSVPGGSGPDRRKSRGELPVRIIACRISEDGEIIMLATTLMDHRLAPAAGPAPPCVCGRPLWCKQDSEQLVTAVKTLSYVRPPDAAFIRRRRPAWCSRTGSGSPARARGPAWPAGSSDPVLDDPCPRAVRRPHQPGRAHRRIITPSFEAVSAAPGSCAPSRSPASPQAADHSADRIGAGARTPGTGCSRGACPARAAKSRPQRKLVIGRPDPAQWHFIGLSGP